MKKIYLFLSVLICFTVHAQLTQQNHAPASGETFATWRCDSVTTDPGASGTNVVWDFSAVETYTNLVRNYMTQAVTTTTYPAANVALASAANDIYYLHSKADSLLYYGGNIAIGIVSGNITYSSPAVFATYPMNHNSSASTVTGGSVFISALSLNGTFTGSSSVVADGSGTISLPGGITFSNTLRTVTSQTLDIAAAIANATVIQTNYRYYVSGIKAPVFSIFSATAVVTNPFAPPSTTNQMYVELNTNPVITPTTPPTPTSTVGFTENSLTQSHFMMYPNPSGSVVNFTSNHPDAKYLSVYDITGKLVETLTVFEGKAKIDVSSYSNGLYLYRVTSPTNKPLKSGKLTVSH